MHHFTIDDSDVSWEVKTKKNLRNMAISKAAQAPVRAYLLLKSKLELFNNYYSIGAYITEVMLN